MLLHRIVMRMRIVLHKAWLPFVLNWRKWRFISACRWQGVSLTLGKGVHFFHPVRVNSRYGLTGKITVEDGVMFGFNGGARWLGPIGIEIRTSHAEVVIGRGATIMRNTRLVCFERISIGQECTIGDGCLLVDSNVHDFRPGAWHKPVRGKPIELAARVHVGPDSTVLQGVRIGADTVIGNRSVVQTRLPARCVAMGNPAKVILLYPPDDGISLAKPSSNSE